MYQMVNKTLLEKEKMLITSISSFSHIDFIKLAEPCPSTSAGSVHDLRTEVAGAILGSANILSED